MQRRIATSIDQRFFSHTRYRVLAMSKGMNRALDTISALERLWVCPSAFPKHPKKAFPLFREGTTSSHNLLTGMKAASLMSCELAPYANDSSIQLIVELRRNGDPLVILDFEFENSGEATYGATSTTAMTEFLKGGLVTVRKDGQVVLKILAAHEGEGAKKIAAKIRELGRIPRIAEAAYIALTNGFGCHECRLVMSPDSSLYQGPSTKVFGQRFRETFNQPELNPYQEPLEGGYVEVVDF